MGGHEEGLQARFEEGVGGALEVDHLLAVGDRVRALGVGDSAHELVGDVHPDEDADLAAGIAPPFRQLRAERLPGPRHLAIVIRARVLSWDKGGAAGQAVLDPPCPMPPALS